MLKLKQHNELTESALSLLLSWSQKFLKSLLGSEECPANINISHKKRENI